MNERGNLQQTLSLTKSYWKSFNLCALQQAACKTVAVFLHYFNLVSFTWMLVEGIWLYLMIVRVFESGHSRMKKYCASAWGKFKDDSFFFQQFNGASEAMLIYTILRIPDCPV